MPSGLGIRSSTSTSISRAVRIRSSALQPLIPRTFLETFVWAMPRIAAKRVFVILRSVAHAVAVRHNVDDSHDSQVGRTRREDHGRDVGGKGAGNNHE